jgi:hypothetical protein
MENINSVIKRKGVIHGIYFGILLLILGIFLYYYKTQLTESFFMIAVGADYIMWLVRAILAALFCYTLRIKIGGYWNVRQATTGIFIMFLVTYAIQFVGRDLVFEKVIDKNVAINTHNSFTNANQKLFKENSDLAHFKERQKKIDETYPLTQKRPSIYESVISLLMAIIFIFVISLLFAAVFKRELIYR